MKMGLATDNWKRTVADYVKSSTDLWSSMALLGFMPMHPIPVDVDGELFGGAHRLACAIALGIDRVPVTKVQGKVWAPPWHLQWFIDHGMPAQDLKRLEQDWELMRA